MVCKAVADTGICLFSLSHLFSDEPLREYVNETVVLALPAEITVHTIDWFSVWELTAMVSLGELEIPDDINITAAQPPGMEAVSITPVQSDTACV